MDENPADKEVRSFVTTRGSGNNVHLQKPKRKTRRKPKPVIVASTEDVAGGFVEFLRKNGVVALAVGFVVATQVQVLAKQLISSFIDPMFTLLFGSNLSSRAFTLTVDGRSASFTWGAFVYGLINFIFVILCLYLVIRIFKLDRLDKAEKKLEDSK